MAEERGAAHALDVWLHGRRAGRLEQVGGRMRFTYAADYVTSGGAPLSCSLPLGDREYAAEAETFFANLLPEGEARTLVARRLGVSAGNDFGLLYAIGGDCAGAVTLLPPGAAPDEGSYAPGEVRWLDEPALAAALDELPRRPLLAGPDEGIRLSLAGAQDKLPVVVRDGRIGVPLGRTPSTHIVKTPIVRFEQTRLGAAAVRRRVLRLAERTRHDASKSADRIGPRPVLDRVLETIDQRTRWLASELG